MWLTQQCSPLTWKWVRVVMLSPQVSSRPWYTRGSLAALGTPLPWAGGGILDLQPATLHDGDGTQHDFSGIFLKILIKKEFSQWKRCSSQSPLPQDPEGG